MYKLGISTKHPADLGVEDWKPGAGADSCRVPWQRRPWCAWFPLGLSNLSRYHSGNKFCINLVKIGIWLTRKLTIPGTHEEKERSSDDSPAGSGIYVSAPPEMIMVSIGCVWKPFAFGWWWKHSARASLVLKTRLLNLKKTILVWQKHAGGPSQFFGIFIHWAPYIVVKL